MKVRDGIEKLTNRPDYWICERNSNAVRRAASSGPNQMRIATEVRSETVRANNLAHLPPHWIDPLSRRKRVFRSQTAASARQLFEIPFAEFSTNFVHSMYRGNEKFSKTETPALLHRPVKFQNSSFPHFQITQHLLSPIRKEGRNVRKFLRLSP